MQGLPQALPGLLVRAVAPEPARQGFAFDRLIAMQSQVGNQGTQLDTAHRNLASSRIQQTKGPQKLDLHQRHRPLPHSGHAVPNLGPESLPQARFGSKPPDNGGFLRFRCRLTLD